MKKEKNIWHSSNVILHTLFATWYIKPFTCTQWIKNEWISLFLHTQKRRSRKGILIESKKVLWILFFSTKRELYSPCVPHYTYINITIQHQINCYTFSLSFNQNSNSSWKMMQPFGIIDMIQVIVYSFLSSYVLCGVIHHLIICLKAFGFSLLFFIFLSSYFSVSNTWFA